MIEISETFTVETARLTTKPKKAAAINFIAEDGTRLRWTSTPCEAVEIALDSWLKNRRVFILGRAAELTNGTLLLADGARVVYGDLPEGCEAIPGVYVD